MQCDSNSKNNYKNIFLCPLNKNDCVNSIDIIDDFILYGTIMGNVYLCRIHQNNNSEPKKKIDSFDNEKTIPLDNERSKYSKNETFMKCKMDEKETSRISCIKINTNINNYNDQFNGNETLRTDNNNDDKMDNFIPEIEISPPKIYNNHKNYKNYDSQTKRGLFFSSSNKNKSDNDNNISNQSIPFPQVTQLILNATENIPCVSFDTKDKVNISIGDFEVIRLEDISTFNINDENSNYKYIRIRHYNSENEHLENCENATCMMTDKNFLILYSNYGENTTPIKKNIIDYQNKQISSLDIIKGNIEMYNYSIPFDFDGDRFLFLDYESDSIRRICIYYTATKKPPYIFKINHQFGHINYMKLLLDDKIVLCKNLKYCEIHLIDDNFKLLDKWEHCGNEIIAMNIYIKGAKETDEFFHDTNTNLSKKMPNDNNLKMNKAYLNDIYAINNLKNHSKILSIKNNIINNNRANKIKKNNSNKDNKFRSFNENTEINYEKNKNSGNIIEIYKRHKTQSKKDFDSESEIMKIKSNRKSDEFNNFNLINLSNKKALDKNIYPSENIKDKNDDERNLYQNKNQIYIITADINGNFNVYHNQHVENIFNLYKISNIDNKYKEKEFFNLGFPYYIIMNSKYYAISTDHGIFVLSNEV